MLSNILEDITLIKESIDKGEDYKQLKEKFFSIVDLIKIDGIKDDKIIKVILEIRNSMITSWRPKQYSIESGVLLWSFLVLFGSFCIYCTFIIWNTLSNLGILMHLLYIFALILGWLSINIGIHNLSHYIAGKIVGINFNSWVIRNAAFQWALIIDYDSYLKSTFKRRIILHSSGPICTLFAPWIIFLITLNPIMIGIGIYMFLASLPTIIKKKMDYGRIMKENQLRKENKKTKRRTFRQ